MSSFELKLNCEPEKREKRNRTAFTYVTGLLLLLDLPADTDAKARVSLNSLRHRLRGFLSDYQDFAKNLAKSALALGDPPRYFSLPEPL